MPGGRPTDYKEEYNYMAEVACREGGFTDGKLSKLFKTSEVTINAWKKEHPEFLKSIKRGKDDWDSELIEASLAKRAMGFEYTEITKEPKVIKKPGGDEATTEMVVTKKVKKLIVPDVTAQIIWLKNRQPKRWRDKPEQTIVNVNNIMQDPEEIMKRRGIPIPKIGIEDLEDDE